MKLDRHVPIRKSRSRRAEIRKNRPDAGGSAVAARCATQRRAGVAARSRRRSSCVAVGDPDAARGGGAATGPGQCVPHDIVSRVDFTLPRRAAAGRRARKRRERDAARLPRRRADAWTTLEQTLLALPDRVVDA